MPIDIQEKDRQRMLAIRREFRARLLAEDSRLPGRHQAVFYSGASASVPAFCRWLGERNAAWLGARCIDDTCAGEYLLGCMDELRRLFATKDFDEVRSFRLPDGTVFQASINGFWRELSARYARNCSGVVHVLVAHDRTQLHLRSLAFWAARGRTGTLPAGLKVFGFVELPILVGQLADNQGVTAVRICLEERLGSFRVLDDGLLVPTPARAAD